MTSAGLTDLSHHDAARGRRARGVNRPTRDSQVIAQLQFPPLRVGDIIEAWVEMDGEDLPAGRLRLVEAPKAPLVFGTVSVPTASPPPFEQSRDVVQG